MKRSDSKIFSIYATGEIRKRLERVSNRNKYISNLILCDIAKAKKKKTKLTNDQKEVLKLLHERK